MATFLICSTPVYGHVQPLLAVGTHLVQRGHRVRMLTGARFREMVMGAGLEFASLPPAADYDDRDLLSAFPEVVGKTGPAGAKIQLRLVFLNPMPHQFRALEESISTLDPAAVLVDTMFFGALPLLLRSGPRPPVLTVGVIPLLQSSRDVAPFGMALWPLAGLRGRVRNRLLSAVNQVLFRSLQKRAARVTEELVQRKPPLNWLDWSKLSDRVLQLTTPGFEYPRSDLPPNTEFVGPILPKASAGFQEPDWWPELEQRRVVHVSQGTVDNSDLSELIGPTLEGLAREDVLVVATTGGAPVTALSGRLPDNARVEPFIPYDKLLPHVDVMVTNGGYGGVQFALSHGVPLVVAVGMAGDKPEIAARVAWSDAGVNLKTARPTPEEVAAAVRKVLSEPGFASAAKRLGREMAQYSALDSITAAAESYAR